MSRRRSPPHHPPRPRRPAHHLAAPSRLKYLILIAFFSANLLASAAGSAPLRVAVDTSGSMRGWFRTGALPALVADLRAAAAEVGLEALAKAFVAEGVGDAPTFVDWDAWLADGARPWGRVTPLDAALRQSAQGARAVVVITDDFHDPAGTGGAAAGTTEGFYRALGQIEAARAWLAPQSLPFEGNVDLAPGGTVPYGGPAQPEGAQALLSLLRADNPEVGGRTVGLPRWIKPGEAAGFWKVPYSGPRMLALHLVLVRAEDADLFADFREALRRRRPELAPLLVRPVGVEALRLRGLDAAGPAASEAERCGEAPVAPGAVPLRLVAGVAGGPPRLVPAGAPLDPTAPVRAVAPLAVVATEAHLGLRAAAQDCARAGQVTVRTVRLDPRPGTADRFGGWATPPERWARVTPSRLAGGLGAPATTALDPGAADPPAAVATPRALVLDLPRLAGPDVSRARAAGHLAGRVVLTVTLPRQALGLDPATAAAWFSPRPTDLHRLYSPQDIVATLASGLVQVDLPILLDPSLWALPPTPPPPPPAPPAPRWPWALVAALLAGLAATRPFGFTAAVQVQGAAHVHPVPVGGLLRRRAPVMVAVPGGATVSVVRAGRVRWQLAVGAEALGLARGHTVALAGGAQLVWLGPRAERAAREAGTYDPRG